MTGSLARKRRIIKAVVMMGVLLISTRAFATPPSGVLGIAHDLPSNFSIVYPLLATRLTSGFGSRLHPVVKALRHHRGVDLASPTGTPIRAIKNGFVIFADPLGAYGNLVVLKHKDGFTSHYGHCHEIRVRPGEYVRAGSVIATVGSTGRVTGAHLHLEIRRHGEAIDPEELIAKLGEKGAG